MTVPRNRRIRLVAALFPLALLCAPAAPSGAGTSFRTHLYMSKKFPAFHGRIHSPNAFCVADRKVRLYRIRSGPDKLLGVDRSEDNGTWKVKVEKLSTGAYYSQTRRYGSAALGIVCRPDRSRIAGVD